MDLSMDRVRFLGSSHDYAAAHKVLLGAPMDWTSSGRPGSRFGPQSVRTASELLEEYSPALDRELAEAPFFDSGDVLMPFGDVETSLNNLEAACSRAIQDGKGVLVLGGEHLVTVAAVKALHRVYSDLQVIQFDAHADLRDDYLGQKLSHATAMRRICEILGPGRLWQFGVRSGTREEYALMRKFGMGFADCLLTDEGRSGAAETVIKAVGSRPVYLTIDIDVLDPGAAPGTGTPEPGGLSFLDLTDILMKLRPLRMVGMDVVEVNPMLDASGRTSVAAAKLVRELLLAF
ncbi:MAG: agmatinase [Firmicutes bacterium]|nr:agmatinase [Bacillota bacterium]